MSDIAKGAQLQVYAPSLRSLPEGSLLVMATLPILDWNDCLLRDLLTLDKATSAPHVYAAILMIDPFACWEDIAESLKDAGITGVANFPPASMIERSAAGVPVDAGQELELRQVEWFTSHGFKALFAIASDSEITAAEKRLGSHLDGLIHLPAEALTRTMSEEMELVSLGQHGSSLPMFALLDGTTSKRPT
ncbi:hypothetical protein [Bradyrhizobium sp. WSM2793]|uniref:hypothetical protein n=1 Tax=Bradyrhizobium sp. WSM2793 TaxID=1038866 RepID=UPI00037D47A6|nr:hypothetical protein [Bradyrhizobium sp. WSM2793]